MIAHVVPYRVARGAETYARALVDELNERGSMQHVLVSLFAGEEQGPRVDLTLGVERGRLRRLGFDPRVAVRLRKMIRSLRPRAMVAHGGEAAKYLALTAGEVPYAYLGIGSSHPLLRNPVRRALFRLYVRRAASLAAVSAELAAGLESESGGRVVTVLPNGRDPGQFRPGPQSEPGPPVVLFVGRLVEQKRPGLFVDVMDRVAALGIPFEAKIVGDGPLDSQVRHSAEAVGISVLGARDDVPDLMSHADVLVLTSRPPEGLPGVLIEAGLAAIVAISTDVPGVRDVIDDGVTGFVVPIDDPDAMVDAVARALRDRNLRLEMGTRARERCVARYSIQASADGWERLIDSMRGAASD